MNTFIENQIMNMKLTLQAFETACDFAALQDDGIKNREEEKQLKKLHKAVANFRKELDSIK